MLILLRGLISCTLATAMTGDSSRRVIESSVIPDLGAQKSLVLEDEIEQQKILERVSPRIRKVVELLDSSPPKQEEAREILLGIQDEVERLVKERKGRVAVYTDLVVGIALYTKGYYGAAIPFFAHVILISPKNELALELIVSCHLERSELALARGHLDYAVEKVNQNNPAFHFLFGRLLFAEGRRDADAKKLSKAVASLETALSLGYREPDVARYWLATCYRSLGMPEKALKETRRIDPAKLPPECASLCEWHVFVAFLYADMKQWNDAIEHELLALREATGPGERLAVYFLLANLFADADDHKSAVLYAKKIIESEHVGSIMLAMTHTLAASSYYQLGELDLCMEHAEKVLQNDDAPRDLQQAAYYYLGQCYKDRGDRGKCRIMLEKTVKADPNTKMAGSARKILGEIDSEPSAVEEPAH